MERIATLHFVDGTKISFAFPEQTPNAAARKIKLADFMTSKHVVIEAEGQIFLFPTTNIKYIMLSTPNLPKGRSETLPRHAIVGARIRD